MASRKLTIVDKESGDLLYATEIDDIRETVDSHADDIDQINLENTGDETTQSIIDKLGFNPVSQVEVESYINGLVTSINTKITGLQALVNGDDINLDSIKELADAIKADDATLTTLTNMINARALIASPTFTGAPLAPTANTATNNTQIATTAFVKSVLSNGTFSINAPTAAKAINTTQVATTAHVKLVLADYATLLSLASLAPLLSPGLTGTPTAPTAAPGTNTTQLATTAFVEAGLSNKITGQFITQTDYDALVAAGTTQDIFYFIP